jgi:hypothetical protein
LVIFVLSEIMCGTAIDRILGCVFLGRRGSSGTELVEGNPHSSSNLRRHARGGSASTQVETGNHTGKLCDNERAKLSSPDLDKKARVGVPRYRRF